MQNIFFLFGLRHCNQGLLIVIVYYLKILKQKKKQHIIIMNNRIISSHMDPMYIETAYILLC